MVAAKQQNGLTTSIAAKNRSGAIDKRLTN
jgi:hypothetical protein